jgi:hypothetical protein
MERLWRGYGEVMERLWRGYGAEVSLGKMTGKKKSQKNQRQINVSGKLWGKRFIESTQLQIGCRNAQTKIHNENMRRLVLRLPMSDCQNPCYRCAFLDVYILIEKVTVNKNELLIFD